LKPLPTRNAFWRFIWTADSFVSSSVFEIWDWLKQTGSGFSSWMHYWFRIGGLPKHVFGLVSDAMTLSIVAFFALLAFSLPPISETGNVWNRGRDYSVTFTDQDGNLLGRRGIRQDDAIPLDQIPPAVIQAVLATEDARFFDHFGVDVIGTLRAVLRNARSSSVQGGSSITQQVAKNLFLSPERTIRRKVHEAFLSMWIEARLSKQEILKLYLDRSYLGGGNYGVEAAAQFYFGKSIRDVNLSEAAVLAGLFKAPTNYAPHRNPDAARQRANVVLFRMLDAGFITQGELLKAQRDPAQVVAQTEVDSPGWFLDYAYQDTLGLLEDYGLQNDFVLEVKLTMDRRMQLEAQRIINDVVDTQGPDGKFTQASAVIMDPDGAVRAVIGGRDYEDSQFNRASMAKRQTGSAFKPFVYMAALMKGWEPNQSVIDGPVTIGKWTPKNYSGGYVGKTSLINALTWSYNSIPVKIWQAFGRQHILDTTHQAGITGDLDTYAPMVLGTSELTLMDLTTGYATFASGGKRAESYAVLEIRKPNGEVLYDRGVNAPAPEQAFPEDRVAALNSMLSSVVMQGTGTGANIGFAPVGGKTGTNQGYRDAWFVGFTANHVTGVWVGNDDFKPMNEITGGKIPAPTWKRLMTVADAGLERRALAGVPLTSFYANAVVPSISVTVGQKPSTEVAMVLENVGAETGADVAGDGQAFADDEAGSVLKNMFGTAKAARTGVGNRKLSRKAQRRLQLAAVELRNQDGPQKRGKRLLRNQRLAAGSAPRKPQSYAIPRANVGVYVRQPARRPGFFERLFSSNRKQQRARRKKVVFTF
jgi:penicillin-binding protein 1A